MNIPVPRTAIPKKLIVGFIGLLTVLPLNRHQTRQICIKIRPTLPIAAESNQFRTILNLDAWPSLVKLLLRNEHSRTQQNGALLDRTVEHQRLSFHAATPARL